jgi:hypothetical protein
VGTRKPWALRQPEKDGIDPLDAPMVAMCGLMWMAEAQGYKPGWAYHKHRLLFGAASNEWLVVPTVPPSAVLVQWCIRDRARRAAMLRKLPGDAGDL